MVFVDITDKYRPRWITGGEFSDSDAGVEWSAELPAGDYIGSAEFKTPVMIPEYESKLTENKNRSLSNFHTPVKICMPCSMGFNQLFTSVSRFLHD